MGNSTVFYGGFVCLLVCFFCIPMLDCFQVLKTQILTSFLCEVSRILPLPTILVLVLVLIGLVTRISGSIYKANTRELICPF